MSSMYERYWDRKVLPLLHSRGETFSFSETPYYVCILFMTGTFSIRQFHNIFSFRKDFVVAIDAWVFITISHWSISVISCFLNIKRHLSFVVPPPSPTTSMECITPAFRFIMENPLVGFILRWWEMNCIHSFSSMPPCVCSITTDVELRTVFNRRSALVIDHHNVDVVITLFWRVVAWDVDSFWEETYQTDDAIEPGFLISKCCLKQVTISTWDMVKPLHYMLYYIMPLVLTNLGGRSSPILPEHTLCFLTLPVVKGNFPNMLIRRSRQI